MDYDEAQRLSPQGESGEDADNGLLEDASIVAGNVLESIQALAGTTSCKGVQIARLKGWAVSNHCWIDNADKLGTFSDRGSEKLPDVVMSGFSQRGMKTL